MDKTIIEAKGITKSYKMSKNQQQRNIKMSLSLDRDFFYVLRSHAAKEHLSVTSFTRWFLKKNLMPKNKPANCLTTNEKD